MLRALFDGSLMQPTLYCMQQSVQLAWTMATGDGLVCVAYFVFPFLLLSKRFETSPTPRWGRRLFSAFLWLSALIRLLAIINLLQGFYWLEAGLKNITGVLAILIVVFVYRMPIIIKIEEVDVDPR